MSAPTTITEWLRSLKIPWLVGGENGSADVGAYGGVLDAQVALIKEAVKARMPTEAPSDALQHIGNDRGLIQGGQYSGYPESDEDFAERLRLAWDNSWPYAGTPLGIFKQLWDTLQYDYPIIIQQNGLIYTWDTTTVTVDTAAELIADATPYPTPLYTKTIPAGEPWWRFDDKTDFCSRFMVLFWNGGPGWWTDVQETLTESTAPSLNEVNTMRSIISRWKNAESTCMGIYVHISGEVWGAYYSGTGATIREWGEGNWGGSVVRWDP